MAASPEIARANGKKGGRPKGSKATHTLNAEKGKALLVSMYLERIRPINEALLAKAESGDIAAIRELHDRVYNRAAQALDVTSGGKVLQPIAIIPRSDVQ